MATCVRSVAGVVVTYNRREILRRALQSLKTQTRPLQEIIVVDNASQDGTKEMMLSEFPGVTYAEMPENLGPAGGFAAGMKQAYEHGHHWLWLFNDDTRPQPDLLEQCLAQVAAMGSSRLGIVCPMGIAEWSGRPMGAGIHWRGRPVHVSPSGDGTFVDVDGVTFNAALVSREVVAAAGYPRSDFFMMFEEWEYCMRVRASGFQIACLPRIGICDMKAGRLKNAAVWRGYYQTRNHLAMVLERRSPVEFLWWAHRQAKFTARTLLSDDRKVERVWMRMLGTWHALQGKTGRTIDPAACR